MRLEDIRRSLNDSNTGRVYNEVEGIHRSCLPLASFLIGAGVGYISYLTTTNFESLKEGFQFFADHSYVLGG